MKYLSLFLLLSALAAGQTYDLPAVYATSGVVAWTTLPLPKLDSGSFTLLFSIDPPGPNARLLVEVLNGGQLHLAKILHAGDADVYAPLDFGAKPANDSLRLTATGGNTLGK